MNPLLKTVINLNQVMILIPPQTIKVKCRAWRSILLIALLSACSMALPAADLRQVINLNREWTFQLGDVAGADAVKFDDSKWDAANVPHSFSTPYFAADRFYVDYGWYRKHF